MIRTKAARVQRHQAVLRDFETHHECMRELHCEERLGDHRLFAVGRSIGRRSLIDPTTKRLTLWIPALRPIRVPHAYEDV